MGESILGKMTKFYARLLTVFTFAILLSIGDISAQVTFNIRGVSGTQSFVVSMKSASTWAAPLNQLSSVQIIVKVPHGVGADEFNVATRTPVVIDPNTGFPINWLSEVAARAPLEAPNFDYFTFYPIGITALPFVAGTEQTLFSFTYTGNCITNEAIGLSVSIIENDTDPFSPIFIGGNNSQNLNITNSLDPFGMFVDFGIENAFVGTYLDGSRDCSVNFPVEWLDFTATPAGAVVDIEWATAIEAGNKFFSVERSVDGRLFQEILRVPGQGNSNEVTTYKEVDNEPIPGYSYYRLRQVDFDAGFSYSEVVEVFFDPAAVELGIQVYPNPSTQAEGFKVEFDSPEEQYLYLELYATSGQIVYKKLVETKRGFNEQIIPANGLSSGVYHLRLYNDQQSESAQLIIK